MVRSPVVWVMRNKIHSPRGGQDASGPEPQRLTTSHLFFHVCQDGIHFCHHVLCVVHTEAHWRFKLEDVPPRTISAQQNVVVFQSEERKW